MPLHTIPPLCGAAPRILILGSFPSVRSREVGFFYGHPQNRFWRVMAAVLKEPLPVTIEEKKRMLLSHGVALWDVVASCDIEGSADSTIHGVVPHDLTPLLANGTVHRIYTNGKTAAGLYTRYQESKLGCPSVCLPSTSPANASWSLPRLIEAWSIIRQDLSNLYRTEQ